jgi:hypothetical protein
MDGGASRIRATATTGAGAGAGAGAVRRCRENISVWIVNIIVGFGILPLLRGRIGIDTRIAGYAVSGTAGDNNLVRF